MFRDGRLADQLFGGADCRVVQTVARMEGDKYVHSIVLGFGGEGSCETSVERL